MFFEVPSCQDFPFSLMVFMLYIFEVLLHVFLQEDQHDPLQEEPVQLLGRHLALLSHWLRQTAEQFELHFALHPVLLLLPPLLGLFSSQPEKNVGNTAILIIGSEDNAACLKNSLRVCNSFVSIIFFMIKLNDCIPHISEGCNLKLP